MRPDASARRFGVSTLGGDRRTWQLARELEAMAGRFTELGFVVPRGMGLVEALGLLAAGGTAPRPVRLLLGEDEWSIDGNGLSINRPGVQLVAFAPGGAAVRREVVPATRKAVIEVAAPNVGIFGLRFADTLGTEPALIIGTKGTGTVVDGCVFEDCHRAVEIGAPWCVVRGCDVPVHRDTAGRAIDVVGNAAVSDGLVLGNRVRTAATGTGAGIFAGSLCQRFGFIGNIGTPGTGYTLDYPSGRGIEATGNVGLVNVRP